MRVRHFFQRRARPTVEPDALDETSVHDTFACPVCDAPMRVGASTIPAEFAAIGIEERDLDCPGCGMLARRMFHPSIGYDARLVR